MLIVFSGLPGTGKTTIASDLAGRAGAVYLRVDTIEQAIRNAGVLAKGVGTSGYKVANELALSNLGFGHTVIVDCVNPVAESRKAWADIAQCAEVPLVNRARSQRKRSPQVVDIKALMSETDVAADVPRPAADLRGKDREWSHEGFYGIRTARSLWEF